MPLVTGATPQIETIVVQPTPFCNINCRYCYLPGRDAKTVIAQETIAALFGKVFASGWVYPYLTIIWHAGEPLVVPVSFYRTAFEAIEALRPPSVRVRHSFQTNGMLITREWCDLFKEWEVGVGVSIDGPKRLHDANRVTRSGHGTFDRTLAGIRLLRREDVPFHVISVLSRDSLDAVQEMVDFYIAEGIEDVCFNVEESEGDHVSDLFAAANVQDRFASFLEQFWKLSRESGRIRFIREIDGMLPRIFRPDATVMGNAQVEPFGMMNVDCHGNVSSFSPELLGLKHADYNDFIVGNINTDSLDDMRRSAAMTAMARDIRAGVEACRARLRIFLRVRRRGAGEQAFGKRQLRQYAHRVLQPDEHGSDRSHSERLRPIWKAVRISKRRSTPPCFTILNSRMAPLRRPALSHETHEIPGEHHDETDLWRCGGNRRAGFAVGGQWHGLRAGQRAAGSRRHGRSSTSGRRALVRGDAADRRTLARGARPADHQRRGDAQRPSARA